MTTLSIVIPTYNRRAILVRTLPAIVNQDFPADGYEVIVVVDGSSDGTIELLRKFPSPCPLRVLEKANRGPASARNTGIKAARGEIVLFLDDDILCDSTLVSKHVAAHRRCGPAVVLGAKLIASASADTAATDRIKRAYENHLAMLQRHGGPRSPWEVWINSNTSMPRSILAALGGYDETLRTHEDADLAIRLWRAGARFKFEPNIVVRQIYEKAACDVVRFEARQLGLHDVAMCRRYSAYRPYSLPARAVAQPASERLLASLACRSPISPEPLLRAPFWAAEKFRRNAYARRAANALLRYRVAIAALRGAVERAGSWNGFRGEFGVRLPVLLYHHVGPYGAGIANDYTMSPERFESHLRLLSRRGYVGIRPSDWLDWLRDGKRLPPKPVLLTFDDAFADLCRWALPMLERHDFRATVFVVSGQIGGRNVWDGGAHRLMSAGQIREWASRGVEFGAHSRTHADMTTLGSEELKAELAGSRDELSAIVGKPIRSFAYPYGYHNERVRERVAEVFELAFSADGGLNNLSTDPYLLRRIEVSGDVTRRDLAVRVRLGFKLSQLVRSRLRIRTRLRGAVARFYGAESGRSQGPIEGQAGATGGR
jgi:glycosyltransferase involved in cell wall biosynthesis/peptidoglycan/xylan/chitin deacetylase (PgdA/CDA1 family)